MTSPIAPAVTHRVATPAAGLLALGALGMLLAGGARAEYPQLSRALFWEPYRYDAGTLTLYHLDEAGREAAPVELELGDAKTPASAADTLLEAGTAAGGAAADDETGAARRVGSGHAMCPPAALDGACEPVPEGRFNGALRFTGGDGVLIGPDCGGAPSRTLEFWLRPERLPAAPVTLAYFFAGTEHPLPKGMAHQPVELRLNPDGRPQVVWRGKPLPPADAVCAAGQWTHLGVAWSAQWPHAGMVYIVADGRTVAAERVGDVGPECQLGAFLVGNGPKRVTGFSGLVDEVRLSREVRSYYRRDLDWPAPERAVESAPGQPLFRDAADLVLHLPFDKSLAPARAAPGTRSPAHTVSAADEELNAAKVAHDFPPGVAGTGLLLGGASLAPVYAGAGNLDPAQGTIAFWLRPLDWDNYTRENRFDNTPPLSFGLFQVDGAYADGSYDKNFSPSGPLLEFNIHLNLPEGAADPVPFDPGSWTHIAMTWEGTGLAFFVNGERRDPDSAWSVWLPIWPGHDPRNPPKPEWWRNAKPTAIRFGNRRYWEQLKRPAPQSAIDEFRVYRRVLAPSEIRNLARLHDPRTKPAPLPAADLAMAYNGVSGRVHLEIVPLLPDFGKATTVAARVLQAGAAAPVGEGRAELGSRKQATLEIQTPPLAFAEYQVLADILDAGGQVLATVKDGFTRTAPPWWEFKGGLSDKAMPEWTPLQVDGATVAVWGREITLAPTGLPERIVSAGADVLAGPVTLTARLNGQEVAVQPAGGGLRTLSAADAKATLQGQGAAGALGVATAVTAEFDGMLWFDMTLSGGAPGATLEALTLRIPYQAAAAGMLHWWSGERNMRDPKHIRIGDLPPGEGVLFRSNDAATVAPPSTQRGSFIPYVMLTGMARGMAWFAENDRGWTQSTEVPAVSVERAGDTVTLVLRIVTSPVGLEAPRTVSFGLHPIPVKPLDPNWRQSPSYSNVFPDSFCGNNLKGPTDASTFYLYPEDGWEAVRRRIDGEGVTKGAAGLKGLYAGQMQRFAEAGIKDPPPVAVTVPGLYWDMQWNGIPASLTHTREWTETWARDFQSYTPAFVDFASWAWHDWLTQTDGFVRGAYIDDAWGCPQTTEHSLVTHRLPDGHLQPGYQFRAWRERFLRMRRISWDNGVHPHLTAHTTHTFLIPYHSFFDLILDGEDFYSTPPNQDDFIDHWPLDRMRFMHSAKWGLITTWLGWCGNSLKTDKWPAWTFRQTRAYVANLALHDILWAFDAKVMADFGLRQPDTVFVPYWDDGGLARHEHPGLKVSAWKRAGKCLVLLVNVGGERLEATVRLDPKAMGLADSAALRVTDADPSLLTYFSEDATTVQAPKAEDMGKVDDVVGGAQTGEELELEVGDDELTPAERRAKDPDGTFAWNDGTLTCPVRRHDYRLFLFAPAAE